MQYILTNIGFAGWVYYVVLILFSIIFYFVSAYLTKYFIEKRVPDFASTEESLNGMQKWELTAGLGVVPKWVSYIWLASISCLIALLVPFISGFSRR